VSARPNILAKINNGCKGMYTFSFLELVAISSLKSGALPYETSEPHQTCVHFKLPQATANTISNIFPNWKYLYLLDQHYTPVLSALYLIAILLRLSQIKRYLKLLIHLLSKRLILIALLPSVYFRALVCVWVCICVCVYYSSFCYAVPLYIEYHCCLKHNVMPVYVTHLHVQPTSIHYIHIFI
jgi:hypothetical protein